MHTHSLNWWFHYYCYLYSISICFFDYIKIHVAVALSSSMKRVTLQLCAWTVKLWCLYYRIAMCLLSHALSLPKLSPLTRSLQFISVTVALESFLLSWPIQECQPKWEGIKVIASHCAWIITGCGGHSTFLCVCRHQFDFAVSSDGVWLEFDAVLSLCDSPPQQMTPDCSRWTLCSPVYMHASYHRLPNGPSLSSEASSPALKPTSPSVISNVHLPQ